MNKWNLLYQLKLLSKCEPLKNQWNLFYKPVKLL